MKYSTYVPNILFPLILLFINSSILPQDKNLKIGEPAPSFALKSIENDYVYLRDFCGELRPPTKNKKQHVVILSFFATWCPPCHQEISELREVLAEFNNSDIKLILINLKEDQTKVASFLKRQNYPGLILLDKFGMVASKYGVTSLPRLFVIGKDGVLVWKTKGYQENLKEKIRTELKKLLF